LQILTREYAEQIARDWNTKNERFGFVGYVLEFEIDSEYLSRFDVQKAGSNKHLEYWIPAAELAEFNRHIRGEIRVISKFMANETGS
jgi:hypothetical protein